MGVGVGVSSREGKQKGEHELPEAGLQEDHVAAAWCMVDAELAANIQGVHSTLMSLVVS